MSEPSQPVSQVMLLERILRGRLVGRAQELAQIDALWEKALTGEGQVLLIAGEPGVGKTRLAREAASQVRASQAQVLTAECYAENSPPFGPWADILRGLLGSPAGRLREWQAWRKRLGPGTPDLLELIPEFLPLFPALPASPPLSPPAQRQRLVEAYSLLLENLAIERPLLLLLDDIQWADEASLDLLQRLSRRLMHSRLLIVATARLDEASPVLSQTLAALNRARRLHEVHLRPLELGEVAALVSGLLGGLAEPSPDFVDAIYTRSEGNPFFIEELLQSIGAAGSPAAGWTRAALEAVNVPRSIRESVNWQLEQLDQAAQAAAVRAAAIGRRFDLELLRAIADLDEADLLAALRALRAAHLLEEQASGLSVHYAFRHALIYEAVYQRSLAAERRAWHGRIASSLQQRLRFEAERVAALRAELPHQWWTPHKSVGIPPAIDQIARHWLLAGEWGNAFQYALLAAERCVALYAERSALDWSTQALDLAATGQAAPSPAALADAYLARCNCRWMMGGYASAVADAEAAIQIARDQGDWAREAVALHWLGHVRQDQGQSSEALQAMHASLDLVRTHDDWAGLAHVLVNLGETYIAALGGERTQGLDYLEQARPLCEAAGDRLGLAHIETQVGHMSLILGRYDDARRHLQRAVDLARELGDHLALVRALIYLGFVLHDVGEYVASRGHLQEAVRLAEADDFGAQLGYALAILAGVHQQQGDYSAGLTLAARSVQILVSIQANSILPYGLDILGDVRLVVGDRDGPPGPRSVLREFRAGWSWPVPVADWQYRARPTRPGRGLPGLPSVPGYLRARLPAGVAASGRRPTGGRPVRGCRRQRGPGLGPG
jgi:tetratricopeptide (TPR) repeat protein